MSTLADVFRELNELTANGLVRTYAIGGATAVLFHAEPARTYDIDVFVVMAPTRPPRSCPLLTSGLVEFYEILARGRR